VIRFDQVSVVYSGSTTPALAGADFEIPEGELCLVVGRTGTGKSTLLRAVNGLVPHFSGGTLYGRVVVAGRDTRTHPPRELVDVVGMVAQDPLSGFVTDVVEDELAYGMESLGLSPAVMRRRVEDTLDLLGLADLRDRPLRTLSGGQRQRVAIGSVLTTHPKVLVLDEPTSALDPVAAEEVLAALHRLVHDLGLTVLLAEHRLERVIQFADLVVLLPGLGEAPRIGTPADMMRTSQVVPPVVELGRLVGWSPLPLSIRDARRAAAGLTERLLRAAPPATSAPTGTTDGDGASLADVRAVTVSYPGARSAALKNVTLSVGPGEIVALMGRNGAGKSTLLATLVGLRRPDGRGTVRVDGQDPAELPGRSLLHHVGLVPSEPADLLYAETVADECAESDRAASSLESRTRGAGRPGRRARRAPVATTGGSPTAAMLARLAPGIDLGVHPRDLSEGQRLALVLAVVLVAEPPLVLLDEPTRGLDYGAKAQLVSILRDLAARGHAVVLATHDVELVAEVAHRTVVLAEGEVVGDGATADVVVSSPAFAPQVSKVLTPGPWLTVAAVAEALERAG
jgi:energy-coupling factor transport system ATP-binding protein